jgi:hypothetical protein
MTTVRPRKIDGMGYFSPMVSAGLITCVITGCITSVTPAPTAGYGAPYHGNGQRILVGDSTAGWDVKEGGTKITSEQALEATGDSEYEARRQIARHYNERLFDQGRAHARNGTIMVVIGVAAAVAGVVLSSVLANSLRSETVTPATADMPEMRSYDSGSLKIEGAGLAIGGVVIAGLGYYLGIRSPPYHEWKTPAELDRPAYVRQLTEPYNEKMPEDKKTDKPKPSAMLPGITPVVAERHMPKFRENN